MNVESAREYCLKLNGCTESFPFGVTTLVMKVGGKMFALINLDENPALNLKCDPEKAITLRESFDAVLPGYHMNKKHWNTVLLDGSIKDELLMDWINDSYHLVVNKLPLRLKNQLGFK